MRNAVSAAATAGSLKCAGAEKAPTILLILLLISLRGSPVFDQERSKDLAARNPVTQRVLQDHTSRSSSKQKTAVPDNSPCSCSLSAPTVRETRGGLPISRTPLNQGTRKILPEYGSFTFWPEVYPFTST